MSGPTTESSRELARELACERALEALLLGPPIDATDDAEVQAWLDGCGVTERDDRRALAAQLRGRLPLYRDLVRERLSDALAEMLPRTRELLGARWNDLLQAFYTQQGPKSPILRELLGEYLDYVTRYLTQDDGFPPWLADWVRYEASEIRVAARGAIAPPAELDEVDPQSHWTMHPNALLEQFDYAVHPIEPSVHVQPKRATNFILGYCDENYEVRRLQLSSLGASLVRCLKNPTPLGEAVMRALQEACDNQPSEPLDSITSLLAELHGRGLLVQCLAPS